MATTPNDPTESFAGLDQVIADYLQAVEAGQVPNRQELLERHPDLAEPLRAFFDDFDRVDLQAEPLRLAGDAVHAMSSLANAPGPSALFTIRYFGDYELLEEIARGGMGVVFKARQASLNRIVALKMIVKGALATSIDVARFRAEAESAAALDHPHIVPIHEVGEHEGQQYFAMRYVEGTTLARAPRGSARAEVTGLLDVARAVHFAHQRGILHRDLKPSNVLIDSTGTAFVTDFGLAKRTGADSSLTETGQPLGTPRYMAPEQAAGRKDLTVGVDVYSLGVILFERLTGRPPFVGDNVLEVLRQVREIEPPLPSSIRPGIDRDLETVVLNCLEKEPARRYASAELLVEDLENWLAGRPITARPVGQTERFWRWCRRNPTVAALTAAFAASLIVGIAGLASGWRQASRRAIAESRERVRAVSAEKEMEGLLARGFVKPLDLEGSLKDTLSAPEAEELWELARLGDTDIGLRFLDEATKDPIILTQLSGRSEPATIAAVGLNAEKRNRASRLLTERLGDPELRLQSKVDLAFVALEFLDQASPETEANCGLLVEGMSAGLVASDRLIAVSERIDPRVAAKLLAEAIRREKDPGALSSIASALANVVGTMDPTEAARVCDPAAITLAEALGRPANAEVLWKAGDAPAGPTRAGPNLASALQKLTGRVNPTAAARVCGQVANALGEALGTETDANARWSQALALYDVSGRMDPTEAARVCGRAAKALAGAFGRETNDYARASLARALSALSGRMDRKEAARACGSAARTLVKEFNSRPDPVVLLNLASAFSEVSGGMEPREAARVCGQAAQLFAEALGHDTIGLLDLNLAIALSIVSRRMDPTQAARTLAEALRRVTDAHCQEHLTSALYDVSGQLDPTEAARICGQAAKTLAEELGRERHEYARPSLASMISRLSGRMDSTEAARICGQAARTLAEALGGETNAFSRARLASELSEVLGRKDPAEAARVCGSVMRLSVQNRVAMVPARGQWGDPTLVPGLLRYLDRGRAKALTREVVIGLASTRNANEEGWSEIMDDTSPAEISRRADLVAMTISDAASGQVPWAGLLAAAPLPCRLTTQDLVEVLKMPTCFGKARRAVLDRLGNRYGRRFVSHWAFVRFATEKGLDLDFNTPPRRPDPAESVKRMLQILDGPE